MADLMKIRDESGNAVYVSTSQMVVPYRPLAELEKWVKYRLAEKSAGKTKLVIYFVVGFFILGGPLFVISAVSQLLAMVSAGAGGAAATAGTLTATAAIVAYFYACLASFAAMAAVYYYTRPTHLSMSDQGVRLLWRPTFFGHQFANVTGKLIAWDQVSKVVVSKSDGKPNPNNEVLTLLGGSRALMKLRLGALWSMQNRSRVLEAIERWAPEIHRDADVIAALEPPADYSYTELWMKALSAPPKRERLKPLPEGAFLQDGKYSVGNPLGVGGQGTAYLAYDRSAENATVVLKEFILPVYVDITVRKQALDKFENEAKILKQLDHNQIVKLIDFFVEDHRGYLVLEHIDGESLRQKVQKEGKLSESMVSELAVQMCSILAYLHRLSPPVVHRDFTPDNLILRKDGTLKLVDFNVAQKTESTATGTVVGKHAYLPPEQFRGLPTTRSDIYAMGASLFYLLTGCDPEPISQSRPRLVNEAVSHDMDLLVQRATSIDPDLRFQDAESIAEYIRSTRLAPTP